MSIPVVESPRFSWVVLFAERSAVDTRSRESKVASEVCLTFAKMSFAFSKVSIRPLEPGARYSLRESGRDHYLSVMITTDQYEMSAYLSALSRDLESPSLSLVALLCFVQGHSIAYRPRQPAYSHALFVLHLGRRVR